MLSYSEPTANKLVKVLAAAGRLPKEEVDQLGKGVGSAAGYLEEKMNAGVITEETLCAILAKGYSLRRVELSADRVNKQAFGMLPRELITSNQILPFELEDRFLKIAVVDPVAMGAAETLKGQTKLNIEFFLCNPSEFGAVIKDPSLYMPAPTAPVVGPSFDAPPRPAAPIPPPTNVARMPQGAERVARAGARKSFRTRWPAHDPDLVVEFCDQILREAIHDGCSDIHIETFREIARVRMRRDGALQVYESYSDYLFKNYQAVTTRFKIMAACDISEKRLAQDGAITITDDAGRDIDFRFNVVPTKNGERIVMRILAGDAALALDKIGLDPADYQKVVEAITAPQGMVLVTGPTGSGKTTTLYGALQYINSPDINILTAEDPVEYYLEGAGQVQANEKIGLSFSSILRAFLRQDPEVILVGEIRDQETIDIAVKAALTGHLLLSTLHTNDSISSITRMLNMGVPNFMISSALSLIVAQRLARKNCASCREPDPRATPEVLRKVGFDDEDARTVRAMRGAGCPVCNGSGQKGRRGIYEVLRKTKHIEEAILRNEQAPQLLEAARHDGFKTMQEIGRELIRSGDISVEEYQRTLVMD